MSHIDKPDPPAEVWVNQRGCYGAPPLSDPDCPRYVLAPEGSAAGVDIPRFAMLDLWMALGGDPLDFETWMDDPKRTPADAWAQLLAAVRGDPMEGDHNPEPGLILALVRRLAPEGSAVIPPELVEAAFDYMARGDVVQAWLTISPHLRAARDGAS